MSDEFQPGDRVRLVAMPEATGKVLRLSSVPGALVVQLDPLKDLTTVRFPEELEHIPPTWDDVRPGDIVRVDGLDGVRRVWAIDAEWVALQAQRANGDWAAPIGHRRSDTELASIEQRGDER